MVTFEKAKTYNPEKHSGFFIVEEKLDGLRLMLKKGTALFRDQLNVWSTLPEHIQRLATDQWIDGELYIPGSTASEAMRIENQTKLHFSGFYLPGIKLKPREHHTQIKVLGIEPPKVLGRIQTPSLFDLQTELNGWAGSKEGFILKKDIAYPAWYKFKVEQTSDLVILGFTAGTGKYKGKIGAIICGAIVSGKLTEVAKVSGMVEEIRFSLTNEDIGRIVEVRYQEIASRGKLRHPRFVRFRNDKVEPDKWGQTV